MSDTRMSRNTTDAGYGWDHQKLRAEYKRRMDAGERFNCWRCGLPVDPARFDLGHDDLDRSVYHGPEHVGRECPAGGNRATYKRRRTPVRRWDL